MVQQTGTSVDNKFVGGLNTDASGIAFPDNSAIETENCIFETNGTVKQRYGIDLEEGYSENQIPTNIMNPVNVNASCVTFVWKGADGEGNIDLAVVQLGKMLYFYNLSTAGAVSDELEDSLDFYTAHAVGGTTETSVRAVECQFSVGFGKLFVVHPNCEPFYVTYDETTGQVTSQSIIIEVRDTVGVDDDLDVSERPVALTDLHKYNLFNQGWPDAYIDLFQTAVINSKIGDSGGGGNYYPSNSDIWWLFKDADDAFTITSIQDRARTPRGTSPAPKGEVIGSAFNFNREELTSENSPFQGSGEADLDLGDQAVLSSGNMRPSCVAFFAGRVFYAGVPHKDYVSNIYVTKTIESESDYGKCYQANSPASEERFDLLPSDGLVIKQPDMGVVHRLFPVGTFLLVFASNGIWAISGSTGIGFTATDYSIQKISSVFTDSATSFVDAEGLPFWWNKDGIYTVKGGSQGSSMEVVSLSFNRIQNFYNSIPDLSKSYARGAYNPITKTIQWLFRDTQGAPINEQYEFNRILTLNTMLNAFYLDRISSLDETFIIGIIPCELRASEENILNRSIDFRYLIKFPNATNVSLSWGLFINTGFKDWTSLSNGIEYDSYVITGYRVYGEGLKTTFIPYISVHSSGEDNSVCNLQARWDYTASGNLGKWSSVQRIEFQNINRTHRTAKRRIRGSGRAVQLKFSASPGERMSIVGWSTVVSVNRIP